MGETDNNLMMKSIIDIIDIFKVEKGVKTINAQELGWD